MKRFIAIALTFYLTACSDSPQKNVTNEQGETAVKVDPKSLDKNGCPYPQDLNIKDVNGNPLTVIRVEKKDGKCIAQVNEN